MATKRKGKKKKNPCGDGFEQVKQEVKPGSKKPKFKCVKIKSRGKGIKEKEDNRPFEPKGPREKTIKGERGSKDKMPQNRGKGAL